MDNREKRDFEAGLAADVDAWLKGEPTRRTFIAKLGHMTGMLWQEHASAHNRGPGGHQ
jgi:multiple sugar transport system substrate-binding protein